MLTEYNVACVYTSNISRALRLAGKIEAGTVSINSPYWPEIDVPFGGLLFSVGHIAIYAKGALKLLSDIKGDVPKGNSTYSMGVWLKMNWVRALTTDLPAWVCFVVAALKTL
jgi:hypothetical protein